MALANALLEQLTCPICQDMFTDPMVLKCHHSFCHLCIEGLKQASALRWKVACPVCRESCNVDEIQKDFNKVSLLEAHQKEAQNKTEASACNNRQQTLETVAFDPKEIRLCDICKKLPIEKQCKTKSCELVLCGSCANHHKSIPACKSHNIVTLTDFLTKEKQKLKKHQTALKKEEELVGLKIHEIEDYKKKMEEEKEKATAEVNQWYEEIVEKIARRRDFLINKITTTLEKDFENNEIEEKSRNVDSKKQSIEEILTKIRAAQEETVEAKISVLANHVYSTIDKHEWDTDVAKISVPNPPSVHLHFGKQLDENKAISVKIKKRGPFLKSVNLFTFPSAFTSTRLQKHKEVRISQGTKKIMICDKLLWCLYDDHIEIYDHSKNQLIKSLGKGHMKIPNGICRIGNGNIAVACMSEGLLEFTVKGKYITTISEGNICDITNCDKTIFSIDFSNNRPFLKAFKKLPIHGWKKTVDVEIQNDKCNTFNTIQSTKSSVLISATEENVLIEYDLDGELQSRLENPKCTHLCCRDSWGNVILSNHEENELWMLKNDQTWHRIQVEGLLAPYSATVDEDGGLWVSNFSDTVVCFTCPNEDE